MTTRRIIVGYDRSADSRAAARWALDEAARTGAPVEFLYAYEWPEWAPAVSTVPAPAVWPDGETDRAVKGMLVVGTRGRGAVRGMLLGSVSQHLLRHSACTVAVVRELTAATADRSATASAHGR